MNKEIQEVEKLYGILFNPSETLKAFDDIKSDHPNDEYKDDEIEKVYLEVLNNHLMLEIPVNQKFLLNQLKAHFETISIDNQVE